MWPRPSHQVGWFHQVGSHDHRLHHPSRHSHRPLARTRCQSLSRKLLTHGAKLHHTSRLDCLLVMTSKEVLAVYVEDSKPLSHLRRISIGICLVSSVYASLIKGSSPWTRSPILQTKSPISRRQRRRCSNPTCSARARPRRSTSRASQPLDASAETSPNTHTVTREEDPTKIQGLASTVTQICGNHWSVLIPT